MIKIAIIEDHQVLVDALRLFLSQDPEIQFVGSTGCKSDAVSLLARTTPDVLLLDVGLPDGSSLDLIPEFRRVSPGTNIVVLTSLTEEAVLLQSIQSGVSGFMSKGNSLDEVIATIRKAAQGEIVMPASLMMNLLRRMPREKNVVVEEENIWEQLTPREKEILSFLAQGKTGEYIARQLCIAPLTVRTHIRNLMSKLGVHSRLEAVSFGMKHGMINNRTANYLI